MKLHNSIIIRLSHCLMRLHNCKAICVSPVWVLVIPLPKPYPWNPLTTEQGSPVDPENLLGVFTKDNVRSITRFDHPLFWKTGFIYLYSCLLIWPSQHHQIDLIWTSKVMKTSLLQRKVVFPRLKSTIRISLFARVCQSPSIDAPCVLAPCQTLPVGSDIDPQMIDHQNPHVNSSLIGISTIKESVLISCSSSFPRQNMESHLVTQRFCKTEEINPSERKRCHLNFCLKTLSDIFPLNLIDLVIISCTTTR